MKSAISARRRVFWSSAGLPRHLHAGWTWHWSNLVLLAGHFLLKQPPWYNGATPPPRLNFVPRDRSQVWTKDFRSFSAFKSSFSPWFYSHNWSVGIVPFDISDTIVIQKISKNWTEVLSPCLVGRSLFTVQRSLFTVHCSLFNVHCSLFTVHYKLSTAKH